jgi:hypothetical protein
MQHRPVMRDHRAASWGGRGNGYPALSQRPLSILVFLIPLIVLYEYGSATWLADPAHGTLETIRAHSFLLGFFQEFRVVGRFLPALALVTVLLIWHVFAGQPWRVRALVIGGMYVESALWTIPLLFLVLLVKLILGGPPPAGGAPPAAMQALGAESAHSWQALATMAVGAGLYEELVFRMIGMAALHLVLVDLVRLKEGSGRVAAVMIAAAAFALYHDPSWSGGTVSLGSAGPYFVAGCYFGFLYLNRGFGIAVGVHALYDILVLVVLPALRQ